MPIKSIQSFSKLIIAGAFVAGLSACTTTVEEPYKADWQPVAPKIVTLLDQGAKIRAEDGSFEIIGGGSPINAPAYNTKVLLNTKTLDLDDYKTVTAGRPTHNVRVQVPGKNEELYGILSLYSVGSTADSSDLRAWRISIPEQSIIDAQGGGLSFTTGDYVFKGRLPSDTSENWKSGTIWSDVGDKVTVYHPSVNRQAISWVLWLSDYPLSAGN